MLPEATPFMSAAVWYILQFAMGSVFLSAGLLAPFYLSAIVQTQFAKASRVKGESTTTPKSADDLARHQKARSA